jgi:predicted HTH domain antitoxin
MSITLELDEESLRMLPLGPGERHMQIELACRYCARGWLTLGQAVRMAGLDHFAFAVELAERGIARDYTITEATEDLAHARGQ